MSQKNTKIVLLAGLLIGLHAYCGQEEIDVDAAMRPLDAPSLFRVKLARAGMFKDEVPGVYTIQLDDQRRKGRLPKIEVSFNGCGIIQSVLQGIMSGTTKTTLSDRAISIKVRGVRGTTIEHAVIVERLADNLGNRHHLETLGGIGYLINQFNQSQDGTTTFSFNPDVSASSHPPQQRSVTTVAAASAAPTPPTPPLASTKPGLVTSAEAAAQRRPRRQVPPPPNQIIVHADSADAPPQAPAAPTPPPPPPPQTLLGSPPPRSIANALQAEIDRRKRRAAEEAPPAAATNEVQRQVSETLSRDTEFSAGPETPEATAPGKFKSFRRTLSRLFRGGSKKR